MTEEHKTIIGCNSCQFLDEPTFMNYNERGYGCKWSGLRWKGTDHGTDDNWKYGNCRVSEITVRLLSDLEETNVKRFRSEENKSIGQDHV